LSNGRNILALLLPFSLIGAYLYMLENPGTVAQWMAPYSESTQNSWQISTPADLELLIGKAQQNTVTPSTNSSEGAIRDIANKLISKGVRVLVSDYVEQNAGGEWDAFRGEVRIRPSTVSMGTNVLAQALAHEATHVAQSCRAGGANKNSEPLGIPVDPQRTYKEQLDSSLYKGGDHSKAIELEAYTVGERPQWAPKLLDHFCG
jgi:hypothetical protein